MEPWKRLTGYLDGLPNDQDRLASVSAESGSLLYRRDDEGRPFRFQSEDLLLLIATNTPEGQFCAYAIEFSFAGALPSWSCGCWRPAV